MSCDHAVELPACDHQADGQKPLFQFSVPLLLTGRYLSDKDLETLNRIARSRTARVENPVMLVMAGRRGWEPFAWSHERSSAWIWGRRSITEPLAVKLFD